MTCCREVDLQGVSVEGDLRLEHRAFGKARAGSGISVSDVGITGGVLLGAQ